MRIQIQDDVLESDEVADWENRFSSQQSIDCLTLETKNFGAGALATATRLSKASSQHSFSS